MKLYLKEFKPGRLLLCDESGELLPGQYKIETRTEGSDYTFVEATLCLYDVPIWKGNE